MSARRIVHPSKPSVLAALVVACLAAGCVGNLDAGPRAANGGRTDGTPDSPGAVTCDDALGRPTLRRLTADEIDRTLRDALLLGDAWTSPGLPPDPAAANGFANAEDRLRVTETWLSRLSEVASSAAEAAATSPQRERLAPCAAVTPDRACARTAASSLGRRLYRRALSDVELERYLALYDRLGGDFAAFMHGAVYAMLLSPHVVWRSELGTPGPEGTRALDGAEIASALSFTYTGAAPDDVLLAQGEAGALSSADVRLSAARGLVLDEAGAVRPAARAAFLRFASAWLGVAPLATLTRDPALHPGYDEGVREAMGAELDRFLEGVVFDERGGLEALLTTPTTYVDARLADYYGLPSAAGDPRTLSRVERPMGMGVGLLAQGAFLTVYASAVSSSPTRRGHFIRSRMLCHHVPPPPPSVGEVPPPTPAATTRQRYEEQHAARPDCASCHQLMDPIGFGLEGFDAAGRRRLEESGIPIDDSGSIAGTSRGHVEFDSEEELANELASLPEVSACLVAFEASHAFGVGEDEAACLAEPARHVLEGGGSILDAWIALAASPHLAARGER